ncbi:MAG TPA: hypothetical protein VFF30_08430 [Nitrososphaerales archaeon]|nr:hypothetical protein [Nitrososphaerales archaeon]
MKRTIHIPDIFKSPDASRVLFPRGVLSRINSSNDVLDSMVKRIEFFAQEENDIYGILRNFHVAFSAERSLLELAGASNSVIEVRAIDLQSERRGGARKRTIVEDKLVLKRARLEEEPPNYGDSEHKYASPSPDANQEPTSPFLRPKTPDISVPISWLEKMNLEAGDGVIISNPIENYAVPPPDLVTKGAKR